MKKHLSIFAFILILFPVAAHAVDMPPNFYADLEMGAGMPNDTHLKFTNTGVDGDFPTDTGLAIAGAIGYHVMPWLRVEGEIGHLGGNLGSGNIAGIPISPTQASVDAMTYMANVFYDWQNTSRFTPYIGFGLGAATVSTGTPSSYPIQSNSSDTVFAWQAGVGTSYKIVDNWSAVVDWRYIQAEDAALSASVPSLGTSNIPMKTSFGANEIRAGIRFDF